MAIHLTVCPAQQATKNFHSRMRREWNVLIPIAMGVKKGLIAADIIKTTNIPLLRARAIS